MADLNGDGKPDLLLSNLTDIQVTVLENKSTIGNILFANKVDFGLSANTLNTFACIVEDFDLDGKPEIAALNAAGSTLSIFFNHVGDTMDVELCSQIKKATINSGLTGNIYQWQINVGNGFVDLNNNINYSGTKTSVLHLNNISSANYGYQYRCIIDGINGDLHSLKFSNKWIGAIDSTWENPLNWSCGTIPDIASDVIINSGNVVLNSNATIRSLTININSNFTVGTGSNLTILH